MSITFRSVATTGTGASPRTVTKPAGTAEGDLLVLFFSADDTDVTPTVPDGFVEVVAARYTTVPSTRLFLKTAGPSEPASYNVTYADGTARMVGLMALTPGAGNTIEIDALATQQNGVADRLFASVTTTVANTFLACFATLAVASQTTPHAGMTEQWDTATDPRIYLMTETIAGIGATGTRTGTGTDQDNNTITVAFKEVEPAPPPPAVSSYIRDDYHLFLLQPTVVFAALVNQTIFTYPLSEVTYDTVTTGAFADIDVGMTLFVGTTPGHWNLGVQRIRTLADATKIYIGRSSEGRRPGEVALANNVYLTVLDLREVWARPPFIEIVDDIAVVSKDPGLNVEWRTTTPPPVCNIGCGFARTIDPGTGLITIALDATNSYATADGATIVSYLWAVGDGTIVVGGSTTPTLVVTYPAGFRYVKCTVTDSEGHTASMWIPVLAEDPNNSLCIPFQFVSHRISKEGQQISVRPLIDIPAEIYVPGTLAMIWSREPTDMFDRSHMILPSGWLGDVPSETESHREGILANAILELLDVAGKLNQIHAFSQRVEDDSIRIARNTITGKSLPISWFEIVNLNMDKYIHYLLAWHSTALSLADFYWSGTGSAYAVTGLESDGESFWDQMASKVAEMVPQAHLTCDRMGVISMLPDPMIQDQSARTNTIQADLTEAKWSDLHYSHRRHPRAYWLNTGALKGGAAEVALVASQIAAGSETTMTLYFSRSPGEAPGQGEGEVVDHIGLALSQEALNIATGHHYARLNAFESEFRVTLTGDSDLGIDPALLEWVTFTLPAGRRAFQLTSERMLPKELNIRYIYAREGLTKTIEILLERETVGTPGVSYFPPLSDDLPGDDTTWPGDYYGEPPPAPVPTEPPPPSIFFDPVKAYLMWDGAHVYRTMDLLAGTPTWEFVDTGITGNIQDAQYVMVDATTVGIWLMTSNGIWFCADILAATPSWTNVLPIATVQAADPVPVDGVVGCLCMANYASEPGYLCVATGPNATSDGANITYAHTIFWHTHDYGVNWTQVDSGLTRTVSGNTHGYFRSNVHAMEIFRSAPGTIYCLRSTPNNVLNYDLKVLKSSDLGTTWELTTYAPQEGGNNRASYSLLHPFPASSDPSYLVSGSIGVSNQPDLQRSTDEWASGIQMTADGTPTGYGGTCSVWRVNKISDNVDHVLAWFKYTGPTEGAFTTGNWHLLESFDRGATWSFLYDSGQGTGAIPNLPIPVSVNSPLYNTPNGWPPDQDIWFMVKAGAHGSGIGTSTATAIMITTDHFATAPVSCEGNLATLLGSANGWSPGSNGGIALPKVGVNA